MSAMDSEVTTKLNIDKSPAAIECVTLQEIFGQPKLWNQIFQCVLANEPRLKSFLAATHQDSEVIFTGAGSSAFVGEMVAGIFQRTTGFRSRAVATTDIVTHPEIFLTPDMPILIVSLARSGNSPESLATIQIAEQFAPQARHLIITCNRDGELARLPANENRCVLVLPEESNDKGLAMIGSVTGMTLAAILLANLGKLGEQAKFVERAADYGNEILNRAAKFQDLAMLEFRRVVCLGSGPMLALAREAHLKIQELSDGRVIAKFDSFLGFRHGPKAVVDSSTLIIFFLSSDPNVIPYERDLIESIAAQQNPLYTLAVGETPQEIAVDEYISMSNAASLPSDYLLLPALLPAQLLAAYKSKNLGLNPDRPSRVIHRVVQGVTIYPRRPRT